MLKTYIKTKDSETGIELIEITTTDSTPRIRKRKVTKEALLQQKQEAEEALSLYDNPV